MLIDSAISFVPVGSTLSLVGALGEGFRSGIIDLAGVGQGVAPPNIIGTATKFGMDPGIDWPRMQAQIMLAIAATAGTGVPTVNFKYQGAEEDATTHYPGTWQTIVESGEIATADMALNAIAWQFDFEPTRPISFRPRFLSVLCQVLPATNLATGSVVIPVTTGLDQQKQQYQSRNYAVGAP